MRQILIIHVIKVIYAHPLYSIKDYKLLVKQTQIIAAIDIGSNSVHMLLAYKKTEQKLAIIKSYKRILTLGRSLDQNLNIPDSSVEKICATLERMKEKVTPTALILPL